MQVKNRNRRSTRQPFQGERKLAQIPEMPEGISFILWVASLAASYEPGNTARRRALLDLFAECRHAVDGDREVRSEQHH